MPVFVESACAVWNLHGSFSGCCIHGCLASSADDDENVLDVEEFQEALVRIGVYYVPGCVVSVVWRCFSFGLLLLLMVESVCACVVSAVCVRLFDLDTGDGIALAVEALFEHMGQSPGAAQLGIKFERVKRSTRAAGTVFSPAHSMKSV